MKDHEIQKLVSQLRDVAIQYGHTQQVRERIHSVVVPRIKELNKAKDDVCLLCEAPTDATNWREECQEALTLLEDIKKWDVAQFVALPLNLRQRLQRAIER